MRRQRRKLDIWAITLGVGLCFAMCVSSGCSDTGASTALVNEEPEGPEGIELRDNVEIVPDSVAEVATVTDGRLIFNEPVPSFVKTDLNKGDVAILNKDNRGYWLKIEDKKRLRPGVRVDTSPASLTEVVRNGWVRIELRGDGPERRIRTTIEDFSSRMQPLDKTGGEAFSSQLSEMDEFQVDTENLTMDVTGELLLNRWFIIEARVEDSELQKYRLESRIDSGSYVRPTFDASVNADGSFSGTTGWRTFASCERPPNTDNFSFSACGKDGDPAPSCSSETVDVTLGSEEETDETGGSGSGNYTLECGDGQVITGFYGSRGDEIDGLGIICSNLEAVRGQSCSMPEQKGFAGSTGGTSSYETECPAGSALDGLDGRSGSRIDQIEPKCGEFPESDPNCGGGNQSSVGGSGGSPFGLSCPQGMFATGVEGTDGSRVDSIKLICREVNTTTSTEDGCGKCERCSETGECVNKCSGVTPYCHSQKGCVECKQNSDCDEGICSNNLCLNTQCGSTSCSDGWKCCNLDSGDVCVPEAQPCQCEQDDSEGPGGSEKCFEEESMLEPKGEEQMQTRRQYEHSDDCSISVSLDIGQPPTDCTDTVQLSPSVDEDCGHPKPVRSWEFPDGGSITAGTRFDPPASCSSGDEYEVIRTWNFPVASSAKKEFTASRTLTFGQSQPPSCNINGSGDRKADGNGPEEYTVDCQCNDPENGELSTVTWNTCETPGDGSCSSSTSPEQTISITDAQPGETYSYECKATDADGNTSPVANKTVEIKGQSGGTCQLNCGTPFVIADKGFTIYPVMRVKYDWQGTGEGSFGSVVEATFDNTKAGYELKDSSWEPIADSGLSHKHKDFSGEAYNGSAAELNLIAHYQFGYELVQGVTGKKLSRIWTYRGTYNFDSEITKSSCRYQAEMTGGGLAVPPKNPLSCQSADCMDTPLPLYNGAEETVSRPFRSGRILRGEGDAEMVVSECGSKAPPSCRKNGVEDCRTGAPDKCVGGDDQMQCNCVRGRCLKKASIYAVLRWPAVQGAGVVDLDLAAFDSDKNRLRPDKGSRGGWMAQMSAGGTGEDLSVTQGKFQEIAVISEDTGGGANEYRFTIEKVTVEEQNFSGFLPYTLFLYYSDGQDAEVEQIGEISGRFSSEGKNRKTINYVFKPADLEN